MSILTAKSSHINAENETNIINDDSPSSEKPAYLQWYEDENLTPPSPDEPDPSESDIDNIYEYLYQIPPEYAPELPLSDVSDKDTIWDSQRNKTAQIGDIYSYNAEFERYYERMSDCSTWLSFGFNNNGIKLKHANFCRIRHCPVCQWRKSLLWKSNMYVAYDEIKEKYPTHRWLFLTLTVRNCAIGDLRETLREMNLAWQRLIKRKEFKHVVGWIRTTEITRPKKKRNSEKEPLEICPIFGNTHAHPHFHVMLLVKPSYMTHGYVKQEKWAEVWQSVLRVDYEPIVDIRVITNKKKKKFETEEEKVKSAIMETLKYAVKPADLIGDGSKKANEWFYELTRQTFKLRFIASGGVLKNALKRDDEINDNDLIDTGSDEEDEIGEVDERRLVFTYTKEKAKYLYAPQYNQ